jgi:hypothetical protein
VILVTLVFLTGMGLRMIGSYLRESPTPILPNIPSIPAKVALYPMKNVNMRTSPCVRQDNIFPYEDGTNVVIELDDPSQKIETNGQVYYCTESGTKEQTPWILVTVENQTIDGSVTAWVNACLFKADKAYFPCMSVMETPSPVAIVPQPPPAVEVTIKPVQTESLPKPDQDDKPQIAQAFDCDTWTSFVMKKPYSNHRFSIMMSDTIQFISKKNGIHTVAVIRDGREIDTVLSMSCKQLNDLYK